MIKQYKEYGKTLQILFLGAGLILFTQGIKLIKNPSSTPITVQTFLGLGVLVFFALVGIIVADLMKRSGIKILANFPVLGWVSVVSLLFCLSSPFFVEAIGSVDFLAITTPVLAFAGISVANNLKDLSRSSWKFVVVAIFVFLGSYLLRVVIAQLGLLFIAK